MTKERDASADGETTTDSNQAEVTGHAHPSRSLAARSRGFGVAAGYEEPRQRKKGLVRDAGGTAETYGPLPHAGYYGSGLGTRPFQRGQAGFSDELSWYQSQYGEKTSGFSKD
jgi:hypothetical protein